MKPSEQTLTKRSSNSDDRCPQRIPKSAGHSRRVFLFKLSLLLKERSARFWRADRRLSAGPALKKSSSDNSWINLGPLSDFPEGETRLVNYRNPVTTPWDGQTGDIPCWVRRISGKYFRSLPSTARTSDAPCAGSRSRGCSSAPATVALTTRTDRAPPAHRSAASSSTTTRSMQAT